MKKIYSKTKTRKIKKKIKIMSGLIFTIFLIFHIRSVEAGMNDSIMERNRVDGIYAVTNLEGDQHLYYLDMYTMNGRTSYCIDLGVKVTTDIYNSTEDFSISSLSNEQIQYVKSISYFGYQYPGHDDYRFYMAAQELIWEYLSGAEVEWTSEMNVNGARMDIESFKWEILWLRNQYYQELYFVGEENLTVSAGELIVLTNQDGLLDYYEVGAFQNSGVWINGNSVYIQTNDDYVGASYFILNTKYAYSYESQLYYYDNSQTLISNGNIERREKQFWFYTLGNNVNVQLVDGETLSMTPQGQATLEGAVYELLNDKGEVIETFTTDEFGQATLSNLVRGHYIIKQLKESSGYLLNDEVTKFDLVGEDIEIVVKEYVIKNTIELLKVYGKNEEDKFFLEDNVGFSIWNMDGSIYSTIFTDELGIASIQLPYGIYTFKQDNTTYGYSKIDDFEVVVDTVRDEIIRYTLVDSLIKTNIHIITYDHEIGEVIKSNDFQYKIQNKETLEYYKYEGEDTFSTIDGEITLPFQLPYGDYILEQVGVPNGYILNTEKYEFTINDLSLLEVIDGELVFTIDYYNSLQMAELDIVTNKEIFHTITNDYEYQKETWGNVELSLVAMEDIYVRGELQYQSGDVALTFVTDEEGNVLIDSIYIGSYCLIEKESGLEYCFDLNEESKDSLIIHKDIEMTLLLEKTDVILQDTSVLGDLIEGSVVEFYDQDKNLIYTGITNEEGIIKLVKLPKGSYCFKQKEVPDDYLLLEEETCFEITDTSFAKDVSIVNQLAPKKLIQVPNTFTNKKDLFKLFLLVLIGVGIVVLVYEKSHHSHNC